MGRYQGLVLGKEDQLHHPDKVTLANLPTRIHLLSRTSARVSGGRQRIWAKRDDDTGGLLSGNKVRKLEYAVKDALNSGCDTLITCGGLQSNHCRATAAVARLFGMNVSLLLRGTEPETAMGNYFLDRLLGADIRFITPEQYKSRNDLMEEVAEQHRSLGGKPYVVAEGASMPVGVWGYIEAAFEIARAEESLGVRFDAIVTAAGSGGTSAGLEIGRRLHGLKASVHTVNVCDDEDYFRNTIHSLVLETVQKYGIPVDVRSEEISIMDGHVGEGYAQSTGEELDFIEDFARTEGVVLDPVYTGKAFRGMVKELEGGRLKDKKDVLFIHTGGIYGLFPMAGRMYPGGLKR
jgi:D-cysteine desulfhydrase